MIYESPILPIVVPICHVGMDAILPNEPPYYLRIGQKVTFNFGEPINLKSLIKKLKESNATDEEARKAITDKIEEELYRLKRDTILLHNKLNSWRPGSQLFICKYFMVIGVFPNLNVVKKVL